MADFNIVQNTEENTNPSSPISLESVLEHKVNGHRTAVDAFFTPELNKRFSDFAKICVEALNNGNKLLFCGNGGSAADAQHIATEFVVRFVKNRRPLAAIALTTDTSALTAIANDFGYDQLFARQIEAIGKKGDILVGISTSGNSDNILNAFITAKSMDIKTVALGGKSGGHMKNLADTSFIVPHEESARIQECHLTFLHLLCTLVEYEMDFDREL